MPELDHRLVDNPILKHIITHTPISTDTYTHIPITTHIHTTMVVIIVTTALTIILIIIAPIGGECGNRGQDDKSLVPPSGIFTKEEFPEMAKVVNKEMNRKEL